MADMKPGRRTIWLVVIGGIIGLSRGGLWGMIVGAYAVYVLVDLFSRYFSSQSDGHGRAAKESNRGAFDEDGAFAVLGISPSSSDEEIRRAYRELARKHHPDIVRANGGSEATVEREAERMKIINEAWRKIKEMRGL